MGKIAITPGKVRELARVFRRVLKGWLSEEQWKEALRRNAEEADPHVCHSHDFCDANMAMEKAWVEVFRTKCAPASEAGAAAWSTAWSMALPHLPALPPI